MKFPTKITLVAASHLAALCLAWPAGAGQQNDRLGATTSVSAAAAEEIEATLVALERQRAGAILRHDIATMRSLMDRQYYHVDSRGRVRSKTDLLMTLDRDAFRFRVYELESIEVQVLDGGGAALVTGIFRTVQAGTPGRVFRGRYMRTWVRQPDGWKNTSHQTTEIRPAQEN